MKREPKHLLVSQFSYKIQFQYSACVEWTLKRLVKAMAAFVGNSLLDVRERNSMAIPLNIHTKSHNVHGRPTLKLVERFGNGSVRELYKRSIYERSFTSELPIEKYQAKPAISSELSNIMFTCKHNHVFRRNREPSRIPEATLKRLRRKGRKLKEFVYERIRPSIPKSS